MTNFDIDSYKSCQQTALGDKELNQLLISMAGIANKEDTDQTATSEAV